MKVQNAATNASTPSVKTTKTSTQASTFSGAMNSVTGAASNKVASKGKSGGTTSTPKTSAATGKTPVKLAAVTNRTFMTAAEAVKIYGTGTLEDLQKRFRANMSFRIPQGAQKRP